MTNKKKAHEHEHHEHQHDEVEAIKTWLKQYGNHVITALLFVMIALLAVHLYSSRRHQKTESASLLLGSARSVADYETLLNDYGKTPVAPLAKLSLAKLHFDDGSYDAAQAHYTDFMEAWPEHPMRSTAQLGKIFCMEARGEADALAEAEREFAAFAAEHPDHFLTPQAIFGQARCLEQLDQLAEAHAIYEDFIENNPDNLWALQAETLLENVQRKIRRQS